VSAACVAVGSFRSTSDTAISSPAALHGTVPVHTVSVGDVAVLEGDTGKHTIQFPVTLSQPATSLVTVQYTLTEGSAQGGKATELGADFDDRNGLTGTVTFKPNATGVTPVQKVISVMVYGDGNVEGDESFSATLSSPTGGYALGRATGEGTIYEDDGLASGLTLGIGDAAVIPAEIGTVKLKFAVTLSATNPTPVTVGYTVTPGTATWAKTATAGGDFGGKLSGTITFPAGATVRAVALSVWPHPPPASDETVTVTLGAPSDPAVTTVRAAATGAILAP
jgi:hypothetical protein